MVSTERVILQGQSQEDVRGPFVLPGRGLQVYEFETKSGSEKVISPIVYCHCIKVIQRMIVWSSYDVSSFKMENVPYNMYV